jgi:hypothetical protein
MLLAAFRYAMAEWEASAGEDGEPVPTKRALVPLVRAAVAALPGSLTLTAG